MRRVYTVDAEIHPADAADIIARHHAAEEAGLSGADLLLTTVAATCCNGVGADWMPAVIRDAVTALHPSLRLAADIHDVRYTLGGSTDDRRAADEEFLSNGLLLADHRYPWYDPRRYLARWSARRFYRLLRLAGGPAWHYDDDDDEEPSRL